MFRLHQRNMSLQRFIFLFGLILPGMLGCGDAKTVIPQGDFTEEQKAAIKAADAKVAEEESHGKQKR
jgi:hypothetical protein